MSTCMFLSSTEREGDARADDDDLYDFDVGMRRGRAPGHHRA